MFIAYLEYLTSEGRYVNTMLDLRALTREEAESELHQILIGRWSEENDHYEDVYPERISKALVMEIKYAKSMPIKQWYDDATDRELGSLTPKIQP